MHWGLYRMLPKPAVHGTHAVLSSFTGLTSALMTFSNDRGEVPSKGV